MPARRRRRRRSQIGVRVIRWGGAARRVKERSYERSGGLVVDSSLAV